MDKIGATGVGIPRTYFNVSSGPLVAGQTKVVLVGGVANEALEGWVRPSTLRYALGVETSPR